MKQNSAPSRYLEIDALRGVAVLMVVLYHYTLIRIPDLPQIVKAWFAGVDLFLMISGFAISLTILSVKKATDFVWKRITRLVPAYWVCLSLSSYLLYKFGFEPHGKEMVIKYLANLTMFAIYFGQENVEGVYWTLTMEIFFYVLFFLVLVSRGISKLENIITYLLVGLSVLGLVTFWHPLNIRIHYLLITYLPIIIYFPLFISGILFHRIFYYGPSRKRLSLIFFSFCTTFFLRNLDVRLLEVSDRYYYGYLIGMYLIFFLFVYNKAGFLKNRILIFFGNISYPLYLIHMGFSMLVGIPVLTMYIGVWPAIAVNVAGVSALAWLIHVCIEKPVQRWTRTLLLPKKDSGLRKKTPDVSINIPI